MKLHPTAIQKLKEVESRAGKSLDPLTDYEAITEINNLSIRAGGDSPQDLHCRAYGVPLQIGKHTCFPLTCAGAVWLDYCYERWNLAESPLYDVARVWAMAYGRNKNAYKRMYKYRHARNKLILMSLSIPVDYKQLVYVLNAYQSGTAPEELEREVDSRKRQKKSHKYAFPDNTQSRIDQMIGTLSEVYGGTPDYWFWEASLLDAQRLYKRKIIESMEQHKQVEGSPHGDDPRVQDNITLIEVCRELERRLAERGNNETS